MRVPVALLVALVVSAHGGVAYADEKAATAQALFEEARTLMARGHYTAACAKLEGSQSLDPGPGTEFNLALCYEKSGRTASAWATYLSAAAAYKTTNRPEWETRARERASQLEGTLSKLTIVPPPDAPKDLQVTRDGTAVIASALGVAIPVDPGHHVIAASGTGREPWKTTVDLSPGAKATIEIPKTGATTAPSKAVTIETPTTTPTEGSGRKTLAIIVGGAGIVGVGVGAVTGLFAMNENSASERDCPNDGICRSPAALEANESASKWATVSTVGFIAGGVLLAAGVALFVTAPKSSPAPASLPLGLTVGHSGIGASW